MRKYGLVLTALALVLCLLAPLRDARDVQADPGILSTLIVNTTDDDVDVDGCQQLPTGDCTLREAMTKANLDTGLDYVFFYIPDSDPGCDDGVCTITLGSTYGALPPLNDTTDGTIIDGTSQPETNPDGPEIVVNGSAIYTCFEIWSANNMIKGLVINECVYGVRILDAGSSWDPQYNTISGNYIGINYEGTAAAGNTQAGIWIQDAHDNTIGGSTTQARNIISGNQYDGVRISGSSASNNVVTGNYIGTSADGTTPVGNDHGVEIYNSAHHNTIGGLTSAERNVISGNDHGVEIHDDATDNVVKRNYIGTDATGTSPLGNTAGGVYVTDGAQNNYIGYNNTIAHNGTTGVRVDGATTTGNTITRNSIHSNGGKGIALTNDGNGPVSPPEITIANCTACGGPGDIGRTIEVFSDYDGQGRYFEGYEQVSGSGTWTYMLPGGTFSFPMLTATATDTSGNTSEFSEPVRNGCPIVFLPLIVKEY